MNSKKHKLLRYITVLAVLAVMSGTVQAKTISSFSDAAGQHVFYTGTEQHIHQLYWNPNNGWVDQDLTLASFAPFSAKWGGPLASFSDSSGEHVFYVDTNAHVNQLYFNGSGWSNQDLTNMTGSVLNNSNALTGFADGFGEHAMYIGMDQHVHQLYYPASGGGWSDQDLTVQSGASNLASPGQMTSFVNSYEHAIYMGMDQSVYQIYFDINNHGWLGHNQDLSRLANAKVSIGGVSVSSFSDSSGEDVLYVGSDQHVYDLNYRSGWGNLDLSNQSCVKPYPLPDLETALSSYSDRTGEHIYYIDTKHHVYELSPAPGCWQNKDVTQDSMAKFVADTACGSQITSFDNSYGKHVYYVAVEDGFIHQLYRAPGSQHWSDVALVSRPVIGCSR